MCQCYFMTIAWILASSWTTFSQIWQHCGLLWILVGSKDANVQYQDFDRKSYWHACMDLSVCECVSVVPEFCHVLL